MIIFFFFMHIKHKFLTGIYSVISDTDRNNCFSLVLVNIYNILTDLVWFSSWRDHGSDQNVSGTFLSYFCQHFCCRHLTPVLVHVIYYVHIDVCVCTNHSWYWSEQILNAHRYAWKESPHMLMPVLIYMDIKK